MKRKLGSIVFVIILLGASFWYAHIDKNTYLYDKSLDTSEFVQTGVLEPGDKLTQTFVSGEDTLEGINLKMSVSGDVSAVELKCSLINRETGEAVSGIIAGEEIKNSRFNRIDFSRIEGAEGKQFDLVLEETGSDSLNGISLYTGGEDLIVRTVSHRFDMETFAVLLGFEVFIGAFLYALYKLFE